MKRRDRSISKLALMLLALAGPAARAADLTAEQSQRAKLFAEEHANDQIKGIKFGIGMAGTWGAERVDEAVVVDGSVRINKGQRGTPAFWLETHLLLPVAKRRGTVKHRFLDETIETEVDNKAALGVGPFLGIRSSTESALDAMAGGVMFGFRRPGATSNSLNVGVGVALDPNFQVLGDGLEANQKLPGNETAIRYRTKSQARFIVMFSFAF